MVLPLQCIRDEVIKIDPDLTEGWYDWQWEEVFEHRDRIKLLMIWTWNEYHEQIHVEPVEGPNGDWILGKPDTTYPD